MTKISKQLLIWVLFVFALASCKTRKSQPNSAEMVSGFTGLDVNDVSVLFPAADSETFHGLGGITRGSEFLYHASKALAQNTPIGKLLKIGFWPELVTENELFLSSENFKKIVSATPGYNESTGTSRLLTYGKSKSTHKVNMLDKARWHIVSLRFAPCSGQLIKGRSGHSAGGAAILGASQAIETDCEAELRVVAQPILGLSAEEGNMGMKLPDSAATDMLTGSVAQAPNPHGWYFADAAIHLFFHISKTEAQNFAQRLQQLKIKYQDICPTARKPLSVHPCLIAQFSHSGNNFQDAAREFMSIPGKYKGKNVPREGGQDIHFAQEVVDLFGEAPKQLARAAFMTSTVGKSPWIFVPFKVTNQNLEVDIIPSGDPNSTQSNESGAQVSIAGEVSDQQKKDRIAEILQELDTVGSDDEVSLRQKQAENRNSSLTLGMLEKRNMMVVPRSSTLGPKGVKSRDLSSKSASRIFPQSKPSRDSLEIFLVTPNGFQSQYQYEQARKASPSLADSLDKKIRPTGNRIRDLAQMADRINNPMFNNDFSTDCASCHFASVEKSNLYFEPLVDELNDYLKMRSQIDHGIQYRAAADVFRNAPMSPNFLSTLAFSQGHDSLDTRLNFFNVVFGKTGEYELPTLQGVTPTSRAGLQTSGQRTANDMYVMNQFSIYRNNPIVSTRVSNESAVSALLANKWYLKGATAHDLNCNPTQLQRCMGIYPWSTDWVKGESLNWEHCFAPELDICKKL
jgi:hypothetical protein